MIKETCTRVMISVPPQILKKIDAQAAREDKNRSEFLRDTINKYISELPGDSPNSVYGLLGDLLAGA